MSSVNVVSLNNVLHGVYWFLIRNLHQKREKYALKLLLITGVRIIGDMIIALLDSPGRRNGA